MPELRLQEIARIVGGTATVRGRIKDPLFCDYHFDSRQIGKGGLFFALRGGKSDGHRYVAALAGVPGVGAVVARDFADGECRLPLIHVDDPLAAAQQLARHVRDGQRRIRYVGISGSAGKTTTKEFVQQILSSRWRTFRSPENWNNHLGLPFSLMKMGADSEAAVFELAMSDPGVGEIAGLVDILRPDVAVVLNIFPVHLEFLHTLENIARAKIEILQRLAADDVGLLCGDFPLLRQLATGHRGRIVFFGQHPAANAIVCKEIVRRGETSELLIDFYGIGERFVCRLISRTHLENLFAAIVICHHLGWKNVEIGSALAGLRPLANRGGLRAIAGFSIIDETYNSNPEALKKTLAWVDGEYAGEKVAVVGDMLELGADEERFHREVGEFFARLHFRLLITVGPRGEWIAAGARDAGFIAESIHSFASPEEAGRWLRAQVAKKTVILFKASRGLQLEKAIVELQHE